MSAPLPTARQSPRRPCPRCGSGHVIGWGRAGSRPRQRCRDCGRTFSSTTGTPFAYLKKSQLWGAFRRCTRATLSVRRTADVVGIHRDTAFRWRHRLLDAVRRGEHHSLGPCDGATSAISPGPVPMNGRIIVGETWFLLSEKGSRHLDRPARRHVSMTDWLAAPRAWVVMGRDEGGRRVQQLVGTRRPTADDLAAVLGPVTGRDSILMSRHGPASAVATAAKRLSLDYERGSALPPAGPIERDGVRLKRWLRRFRGVATRYLPNYLAWHALLDATRTGSGGQAEALA